MKKIIWVYGLIAGLVVSSIMAVSMITYYNYPDASMGPGSMIIGYLSMLIAFSLIYVAIKSYRDKQNSGVISFGRAFSIGLLIALIASTCYVVVWAVLYHFFIPDFMDLYTAPMLKKAQATGSAAEIQKTMAEVQQYKDMYKSPLLFTLMTYAEILPVGIIVSLICALILKRRRLAAAAVS